MKAIEYGEKIESFEDKLKRRLSDAVEKGVVVYTRSVITEKFIPNKKRDLRYLRFSARFKPEE